MKYIVFFAFLIFSVMPVMAQNAMSDLNQKIDDISVSVQDIKARSFAKQVQDKLTTMEQLEQYSKNWLGSEKANKELVDLIRKYVKDGKPVSITDEERTKLEENRKQIRTLLDGGKKDSPRKKEVPAAMAEKMKRINKIQMSVIGLEARSQAMRISESKGITVDELESASRGWIGTREYKQKLIKKVRKILKKGKIKPFSEKEIDKLEAARMEIRDILQ